jgi:hypothetical protein
MRSLALAQCVLLTLSMVGSHAHRALVRHGYCTDHGELVHAAEEAHSRKPAPPNRDAVTPVTHMEGAHGCAILEFLTQSTTAGSSCCTTPRLLQTAASLATASADGHASIPLLRLSPKHSPPRA